MTNGACNMALNRPRVDTTAVARTSVVLGHYQGPKLTTYHEGFELGRPNATRKKSKRFELAPAAEIFHRTERKYPQSIAQASFGEKSPQTTTAVYQHRKRELKNIMDIHLLNAVPIGPQPRNYKREYVTDTSQMKTDYLDRHHILRQWVDIQSSKLPKLPPINTAPSNSRFKGQTEAAHQFQWPKRDPNLIYQVRFRKN